jgi:integration host factor subunit beta
MGLTMTKHQLIQALQDSQGSSKSEAAKCVKLFFDTMANALAKGDRVEIRGLCTFYSREYEPYTGRNPKTGEVATVKGKKLPYFKAGMELRRRVNGCLR